MQELLGTMDGFDKLDEKLLNNIFQSKYWSKNFNENNCAK
jgi:hypothetical protein